MSATPPDSPDFVVPYDSPRELSLLLESRGLAMSKRFGQNFLVSPHARAAITGLIKPRPGQRIWEVGPGLGALTHEILGQCAQLVAFEIDHGFIRLLGQCFGRRPDFFLVEGDVMKTAPARWLQDSQAGGVDCICGNLPYNTASGFIMQCLEHEWKSRMVYTVQKEAAQRMGAAVDSELYSSFSVHCQARYQVSLELTLGANLFWPAPEVVSAVVCFEPRPDYAGRMPPSFNRLVRSSFAARRKTLLNNLKASPLASQPGLDRVREAAQARGIELSRRAETLTPEDFVAWAGQIDG